ncbi:penicillin acylase family protein [Phyllobacterium sp. 0TCS1.6C]|uniref:penicillin acylase family protein n=1 Tax=unclassified Phyllobacterium TaxID=2638441 RepID=UPI002264E06F|nr:MULTISPECIES: penicillin acylase family protein [unclassified Phyllobacterium]MCX8279331.1 penicillin acylase family protein [Phyllobacterium sp. 0TCS1.6C]MCX8294115.1 penicillin acylase family protein [Phyllobacterium sp. 0TCS1.6A]
MTDRATEETIGLSGLEAEAEIRIDRWGIPHIRAASEADLFLLQGFNAARDRLWQLDLWRKRGLGLLAADFGPGYLAQDHAARHFLYRGDMAAEWLAYADDTQVICTAFAAGVNAYIALCEREAERLPPEFAVFGTHPARWQPEDVVRIRSHALTRNGVSEILRANVMAMTDATTDLLRFELDPPVEPKLAEGLAYADIPLEAVRLFKLATAPVTFEKERLSASLADAWSWSEVTDLGEVVQRSAEEGSNNWAVHGSRTQSGRPILASDPHRAHAVPSLRYLVHLEAPGINIIGTGEPTAPGVSIGHNERTAFGLTIFGADQEDIYVYETKEGEPDLYRYGTGWEQIERIQQAFAVRGCAEQVLTLCFTRHGPVLHEDRARRRAVAMRTVWHSPGSAAYLGSLSYMRSRSTQRFADALDHWGTPSVNHVSADVDGNIGWFTAGFSPMRRNWQGLLPVPGDGSHEWEGFLPATELPRSFNPAAGFVASANEMNLPADRDPGAPSIGHEWAEGSRAKRIKAVLGGDHSHTLSASMALQTDVFSRPAKLIIGVLREIALRVQMDGAQASRLELFEGWDYRLEAGSAPAALFEVWWMKHLRPGLLARFAPNETVRQLLLPGDFDRLLSLLQMPERFWSVEEREALVLSTLTKGWQDCAARLGPDPAAWRWGNLHQALFEHAASRVKPETDTEWNVGPLPLGGSRSTPMHAAYRISDFGVNAGASVRLVMDVGQWDNSVCVNTPGQSGDPRSSHYADLSECWSRGEYVPLLYSREKVDAATTHLIRLVPAEMME